MKTILILITLLFITGCTPTPVYLKNPRTGLIVACDSLNQGTQIQCTRDYQVQGFHRVPNLQ